MEKQQKHPRIRFSGCDFAKTMGIVFAENLDDMLRKVEMGDGAFEKGFLHTSTLKDFMTPCYYEDMWSRDVGRGLQELARYGYLKEAEAVIGYLLSHKTFGDHWGRILNRPMDTNYEIDGNTHILFGIYQTWGAQGRPREEGIRYLQECRDVFAWFERLMDECPYGDLLPCISELSGNPTAANDDPVYAIFPGYGALGTMKAFSEMARFVGLAGRAGELDALAKRLEKSILEKLVSHGMKGHPSTLTPEGVWANGISFRSGEYCDVAFFGKASFPIHHWTRQLPYIQDYDRGVTLPCFTDALGQVNDASYQYLKTEMAKGYYFRKYGFVSNTCWTGAGGRHDDTMAGYGQNYFTQAALLKDDVNVYSKCLEGIARLAYDGDVVATLTPDMSPWIMHECFHYDNYENAKDHTFGTYADASRDIADNPGDEGNLVQAAETLKTIALAAGICAKGGRLEITPRLPWTWDTVETVDYPVALADKNIRLHFRLIHERWLKKCSFTVETEGGEEIPDMSIRLGPFPHIINEERILCPHRTVQNGDATWIWLDGLNGSSIAGSIEY